MISNPADEEADDNEAADLDTRGDLRIGRASQGRHVYLDGQEIGQDVDHFLELFALLRRHQLNPIALLLSQRIIRDAAGWHVAVKRGVI